MRQPPAEATSPVVTAMINRWLIDPRVKDAVTPAVLEAAALPVNATFSERCEAAGNVAAVLAMRNVLHIDLAAQCAQQCDQFSANIASAVEAKGATPQRVQEFAADAWLQMHAGFLQARAIPRRRPGAGRSRV
jgi:hypothetical protein